MDLDLSGFLSYLDDDIADLFDNKENIPPDEVKGTKRGPLSPAAQPLTKRKKRTIEEPVVEFTGDWRFIGMPSLSREEDEHYTYPSWGSRRVKPGKYNPNKGYPTEPKNLALAKQNLLNKNFTEGKVLRIIQGIKATGTNPFVKSREFAREHGLSKDKYCHRVYTKWLVFYDVHQPFITPAKPMALDYRDAKAEKRAHRREVRINPLYLQAYDELKASGDIA